MSAKQHTQKQTKNSKPVLFSRQVLEKVREKGGSVTYFTSESRYDVRTHKTYTKNSPILVSKLNPGLLVTEKGRNTSFNEVFNVLQTTCDTLGADYFVVQ